MRLLRVGLNPQNDAGDLQLSPRHARREKGDILAVAAKRGIGEWCTEEAQAARPVLCDRGPPPRVVVIDKAVEEVFGRRVQRVRLGLHGLIGDSFGPPDFINPHDDGTRRLDRHNAEDDDDEQKHGDRQPNSDHP